MQELQDRIENLGERFEPSDAEYVAEIAQIRKDIVNFHGEMVLLLNYSSVNYTGFAFLICSILSCHVLLNYTGFANFMWLGGSLVTCIKNNKFWPLGHIIWKEFSNNKLSRYLF